MHLIRWLTSRTVRKACELEDAVLKILNHQRDVLGANAVTAVEGALSEYRRVVRGGADRAAIEGQMVALEHVANKWLRPYPSHSLRENVLMLLEIAVLIVRPEDPQTLLWAIRQAAVSGSCAAVLAWVPRIDNTGLRRLQLAAEESATPLFLFRPGTVAGQSSPAPLRLALAARGDLLEVRILKRRGPPASRPILLEVHAADGAQPEVEASPVTTARMR